MVDDVDIWRSANLLIRQYGDEAVIYAAMQADACLEAGDLDGKAMWLRVIAAIGELQNKERPPGIINH